MQVTLGDEPHDRWSRWLREEGERRGLELQTFRAKKGDILIWHADLAHGGLPMPRRAAILPSPLNSLTDADEADRWALESTLTMNEWPSIVK